VGKSKNEFRLRPDQLEQVSDAIFPQKIGGSDLNQQISRKISIELSSYLNIQQVNNKLQRIVVKIIHMVRLVERFRNLTSRLIARMALLIFSSNKLLLAYKDVLQQFELNLSRNHQYSAILNMFTLLADLLPRAGIGL
jgi:dGTP triphosphohydrolase